MNRRIIFQITVAVIAIIMSSCVPGRKYKSLQDVSKQYMTERDEFKTENIDLSMNNKELESKVTLLEKDAVTLKEQLAKAQAERDKASEDYNKLLSKYNDLQNAQEALINGNVKETRKLLTELQTAQQNLQNKEALLRRGTPGYLNLNRFLMHNRN
jgi:predicted nuclease with TOPRIM domain